MMARLISWVEAERLPDWMVREGIRKLLSQRLGELPVNDCEAERHYLQNFIADMNNSVVAANTDAANEQHYEVPAAYFDAVLGPRKKYSACYWHQDTQTLAEAEDHALKLTCLHADLQDGQQILELGCGWGSLTLWMAEHYPNARITAVSNSHSQRQYIESAAKAAGFSNVRVVTADMNTFTPDDQFERIVSVEMFEHMRNWTALFTRLSSWLVPGGKFFMHVFCHRSTPYFFEDRNDSDWMTRYFFAGGMMPSATLPLYFQRDLNYENSWSWNGRHYAKTLESWLQTQDQQREKLLPIMEGIYGEEPLVWFQRWRLFYLACAELFRMNDGNEWHVVHYLFRKAELSDD